MVYDCGSCIAKYILCFFNFVIFLAGSVVLAIGIWLAVDKDSFIGLSKIVPHEHVQQYTQPAVIEQGSYILIAIGAFMFVISFLGYCGALRESQCLLTTYGICLLIILIAEVTITALSVAYRPKAEAQTREILKTTIVEYYRTPQDPDTVTLMWDHLQTGFKCCGVNNSSDYAMVKSPEWIQSGHKIPESCCILVGSPVDLKPVDASCTTNPNNKNSYWNQGCFEAIVNSIVIHLDIVIAVAVVLVLLEIVGIVMAFCLSKSLNGYRK